MRQLACSRDPCGASSPHAPGGLCVGGLPQLALCRGRGARCPLHLYQAQSHAEATQRKTEIKASACSVMALHKFDAFCSKCGFKAVLLLSIGIVDSMMLCHMIVMRATTRDHARMLKTGCSGQ